MAVKKGYVYSGDNLHVVSVIPRINNCLYDHCFGKERKDIVIRCWRLPRGDIVERSQRM
jgi:hypothetical protein